MLGFSYHIFTFIQIILFCIIWRKLLETFRIPEFQFVASQLGWLPSLHLGGNFVFVSELQFLYFCRQLCVVMMHSKQTKSSSPLLCVLINNSVFFPNISPNQPWWFHIRSLLITNGCSVDPPRHFHLEDLPSSPEFLVRLEANLYLSFLGFSPAFSHMFFRRFTLPLFPLSLCLSGTFRPYWQWIQRSWVISLTTVQFRMSQKQNKLLYSPFPLQVSQ